ncbi:MAG: hypothetical protein GY765_03065 [bacterium]|nr:hypothetical protein [bacterium]
MSDKKTLQAISELKESQHKILAPAVGYFSGGPKTGDFLTGGDCIGKIKILNTYYELHLPAGLFGRVKVDEEMDLILPVEYGQELFCLNPDKDLVDAEKEVSGTDFDSEEDAVAEGGHVVVAFTTGIFYAKPSPDSPPFVKEGQEIEKGKALGLIEIMKTFNHIVFHGTDDSDRGVVKKILVKDSEEVKSGQPLFVIE